jgi:hypothetical protein
MSLPDQLIQSYVIKIWLEETAVEDGEMTWRGVITRVPGGDRSYFTRLDAIAEFIEPYLAGAADRSADDPE